MEIKQLEIRDRQTFIPALAIRLSAADGWLVRSAGFGPDPAVILMKLESGQCEMSPHDWDSPRTMPTAHAFLESHWDAVADGGMVDVERVLGETAIDAESERCLHE
jgi:hypothetical protein